MGVDMVVWPRYPHPRRGEVFYNEFTHAADTRMKLTGYAIFTTSSGGGDDDESRAIDSRLGSGGAQPVLQKQETN